MLVDNFEKGYQEINVVPVLNNAGSFGEEKLPPILESDKATGYFLAVCCSNTSFVPAAVVVVRNRSEVVRPCKVFRLLCSKTGS